MNLVFIAQAVDADDLILASTVRWIQLFADHGDVGWVGVITLREGAHDLPSNVDVTAIGGPGGRPARLFRFYRAVAEFQRKSRVDAFFVYQGGPYPVLLLPWRLGAGIPVYQWKAHPHVSTLMWFYARFCDTRVFTSTRAAFPVDLPNVSVVGNGIDVDQFSIAPIAPDRDIAIVGRLSPSKRIELGIETLAALRRRSEHVPTLDVIGPSFDPGYVQRLEAQIAALDLQRHVTFTGGIPRSELPDRLRRYRAILNVSQTALDRAVLEAMACGIPVVSTNPCVKEIVVEDGLDRLCIAPDDAEMVAERLQAVLALQPADRERLGWQLRAIVVAGHSDVSQSDRIVRTIRAGMDH